MSLSSAELVRGKLTPPSRTAGHLARPRLGALLAEYVAAHRLVVVSAMAGAGKTAAVADAFDTIGRPAAWLSVDEGDADPARLARYLAAALTPLGGDRPGAAPEPPIGTVALHAEALPDAAAVVVLDGLERLGDGPAPWTVLDAWLRYAPPRVCTILVSREPIEVRLGSEALLEPMGRVHDAQLRFTAEEAEQALALRGARRDAIGALVDATCGWVTGVLLDAAHPSDPDGATGGPVGLLDAYLSSQVMGRLTAADQEFLILSSVLPQITARRAEAVGLPDAAGRLAALTAHHLPVAWARDRATLACYPRFRDYLSTRLRARPAGEVRALLRRHGDLLDAEGDSEDAVDRYLDAGAPGRAARAAAQAAAAVVERADFATVARWGRALAQPPGTEHAELVAAQAMVALARAAFLDGVALADRLERSGTRASIAHRSDHAAAAMALCYAHVGRVDEASALLAGARLTPATRAARDAIAFAANGRRDRARLSGGPFDAVTLATSYFDGRLGELDVPRQSPYVEAMLLPFRVAALRATGRTSQALEQLSGAHAGTAAGGPYLEALVGPEVLLDAGSVDAARAMLRAAHERFAVPGSELFAALAGLVEAKLALRHEHDAVRGRRVLDTVDLRPTTWRCVQELSDTWRGYALLQEHQDEAAALHLRRAVDAMRRHGRMLELPTAAVYLAEAEWRRHNETAADVAADVALAAAKRQGSNHILLQALADFPAVTARRLDAEHEADSPWHRIAHALTPRTVGAVSTRRPNVDAHGRPAVVFRDLGPPSLFVDDQPVRPRIGKAYELLAYLVLCRDRQATHDELLDALFDGRADDAARGYLRQAVRWLRHVLPGATDVVTTRGAVGLGDGVRVLSDSSRFEAKVLEASRLQSDGQLDALVEAIAIHEQGPYLVTVACDWAAARRRQLDDLATNARLDSARLAFESGQLLRAQEYVSLALSDDRLKETAWRLQMRIAGALGDHDGVIAAMRHCTTALADVGAQPSESTLRLLQRLTK